MRPITLTREQLRQLQTAYKESLVLRDPALNPVFGTASLTDANISAFIDRAAFIHTKMGGGNGSQALNECRMTFEKFTDLVSFSPASAPVNAVTLDASGFKAGQFQALAENLLKNPKASDDVFDMFIMGPLLTAYMRRGALVYNYYDEKFVPILKADLDKIDEATEETEAFVKQALEARPKLMNSAHTRRGLYDCVSFGAPGRITPAHAEIVKTFLACPGVKDDELYNAPRTRAWGQARGLIQGEYWGHDFALAEHIESLVGIESLIKRTRTSVEPYYVKGDIQPFKKGVAPTPPASMPKDDRSRLVVILG